MGFCFQCLNARRKVLDILAKLGGEVIHLGVPSIEGLHEEEHGFHLPCERIQFLFSGGHAGSLGWGFWLARP